MRKERAKMKFITEEELRDLYKRQPFTDYNLQEGERLTPGARQFLLDRGIDMYERSRAEIETAKKKESENKGSESCECRLKSLKALFLLTARDVLGEDVCLSQQITGLYRYLEALEEEAGELCCNGCGGINGENFSEDIGDCFEITEFHMQMENGRKILLLERLRSEVRVFKAESRAVSGDERKGSLAAQKLNRIINTLSQMICKEVGGKECQRNKHEVESKWKSE